MNIIDITPEIKEDFKDFIPEAELESIGRSSFRALGAKDKNGSAKGAIIWEYKSDEDNEYYASEIIALGAASEKTGKELLSEYDERISGYKLRHSFFEFEELTKLNEKLLKGAGFEETEKESPYIDVTVGELADLKLGNGTIPGYVVMIKDIDETELRQGLINSMFINMRGLIEDIETIPLSWFERDVSSCSLSDGRVEGMFLIHRRSDGTLVPVLLMNSGPDGKKTRQDLLYMLRYSVEELHRRYPPETPVKIRFLREQTGELVKKLFPDKSGSRIIFGIRDEK